MTVSFYTKYRPKNARTQAREMAPGDYVVGWVKSKSSGIERWSEKWWKALSIRMIVLAIHGFLFGFRRGDSVASKIRTIGKISVQFFFWRFRKSLCANGKLRLCSYALHIDTVPIGALVLLWAFLCRLRLCAKGYINTPKSFSCELLAFLELCRVGSLCFLMLHCLFGWSGWTWRILGKLIQFGRMLNWTAWYYCVRWEITACGSAKCTLLLFASRWDRKKSPMDVNCGGVAFDWVACLIKRTALYRQMIAEMRLLVCWPWVFEACASCVRALTFEIVVSISSIF